VVHRDHPQSGIGQRIRQAREQRGLTQSELGRCLGVSFQMVQAYEHGEKLTIDRITIVADALRVKLRWLLMPEALIEVDRLGFYGRPANGHVIDIDVRAKAACGLPHNAPPQLAWEAWIKGIHRDDGARVHAELARLDDPAHGVFNLHYRLLGHDGVERYIHDYGRMIFDEWGLPVRLQGFLLDLTFATNLIA
jgi:transcriptional regulator with XRE-family HTH domain